MIIELKQEIMIKLIAFDLDGVLLDAKKIHYEALNKALGSKYMISWNDHLTKYDGLKTSQKLSILTSEKGLDPSKYSEIWREKQLNTFHELKKINADQKLIELFQYLSNNDFKIAICSNSIRKTVLTSLSKLGVIEFVDLILSNEDVQNSKPHPEIYWTAISKMAFLPEETLIVEDSPFGLLAAARSKANILRVKNTDDLSLNLIKSEIHKINNTSKNNTPMWKDEKLNVLIPMAGAGSRFQSAGYTFPKPLIEVNGKPMIQVVLENLNIDANYFFVVQKEHREKYNLDSLLNLLKPNCKIIETEGLTEGAACTALLAKEFINNDAPLFFANSDQFVEWDSNEFFYKMNENNSDGGIVTFKATHPKWSFAKVDAKGLVTEVAEKNPISDNATVGFYYWKKGSDFIKYAEQMIEKNIRINNEFYVCPVFNEAIEDKLEIKTFEVGNMWGIGTPEDLNYYIKNYVS
jgi:HAD superfamily hydrolase (TIGR01509 family)